MPPKLPTTYKEIHRKLIALGFVIDRIKGSHVIYYHDRTKHRAVVPKHVRSIPKGTVKAIVRESGVDIVDFLNA
ncbi:MAG: type II toxin-antitoxin system HicA family toxin [Patescibacteria group bacterium]